MSGENNHISNTLSDTQEYGYRLNKSTVALVDAPMTFTKKDHSEDNLIEEVKSEQSTSSSSFGEAAN
jgi:hypothetical protein